MKVKVIGLLMLLCALSTVSCVSSNGRSKVKGDGNIVTRTIQVTDYESLSMVQAIKPSEWFNLFANRKQKKILPVFNYTQSPGASSLEVTMDENLFAYLKTEVKDGTLYISVNEDDIELHPTNLIVNGSSQNLRKVDVYGTMNFVSEHLLEVSYLDIDISGVGDVRLDKLVCDTLSCNVSGVGHAYLTGKVEQGDFNISGVGKIHAFDCIVKDLDCSLSGIGSAMVQATDNLHANTSGIGKIKYKGEPKVDASSSGIGSVKKVE